ncbi:MAG: flagellar export protein FliJ [Alphaproteobacteria bacterium]
MKANDTLLKLRRFEANEKRQKVADIEMMIGDFKRMVEELSHQIATEEEKSGINDVKHYAYPTFAKAAWERRSNLIASIEELEAKLEEAKSQLADAMEELKKAELTGERSTPGQTIRASHAVPSGVKDELPTTINRI